MLQKLFYYGRENNKKTVRSVFVLLTAIFFGIIPFWLTYQIILPAIHGESISAGYLLIRVLGVLFSLILQGYFYGKGLALSHEAAYGTLMNLRISLQEKLEKQPLGEIQSRGVGVLKKMFVDDIDSLELLLAHGIPEGLSSVMGVLTIYLVMFLVDWKLALLTIGSLPLGILSMMIMYVIGKERMGDYYQSAQLMNHTIIEYINGMEVVKVFNKGGESFEKYKTAITNYRDFTLKWFRACWPWMAGYGVLIPSTLLLTLPFGSYFVLNGYSGLAEFILVLCLALSIGIPLLRTMSFLSLAPQIRYKIISLENLLDKEDLKSGLKEFHGDNYGVEFINVTFGYDGTEVVRDINLKMKQNTMTALVGESGSGKSTLAKLFVHYYDVKKGAICIGGQDISQLSLKTLNDMVSYVSQDNFLFNISLMENIRVGKPDASDHEVMEAAHKAQCMEFINRMPLGFDTLAGDCGNQLSGGEKQRITLARAILKDAPIVVLDEATAYADPENEEKMEEVIERLVENKTLLVIAHRLSSVVRADQICVMEKGQLSAVGTHEELLSCCSGYQELWYASQKSADWKLGKEEA
ncbi:ABC transporter ATP-binding protein [Lacrimispora defluvii]|uniref:ABC transporter ATP-binding protein n=1 Tax=Lacrimispora defluvii TaxID=2719233 RepID=A0ABX1VSV7_9FIRM|nr:ABC transporter ATP-binding protein [Lacrimispora defluvii]NNJ31514.1 ABC transporter ATP-binding protein [Lacrimispora defluvii]